MGVGNGGEDGLAEAMGEKRDSILTARYRRWQIVGKKRNQSGFVWLRRLLGHVRRMRGNETRKSRPVANMRGFKT